MILVNPSSASTVQTYATQDHAEFHIDLDEPSSVYVIMSPDDSDLSLISSKQPIQVNHNIKISHLIPGKKYQYSIFARFPHGVAVVEFGSITTPMTW
jgi:hypothetical protein